MPANTIALGCCWLGASAVLVLQPDFGQTMLIALVWGALFFMAGMRLIWVVGLGGAAVRRPRRRLFRPFRTWRGASSASSIRPPATPSRSTPRWNRSSRGGWFGRGPGEGTVKRILPDSHADFVFAVAAEEFGIVLCLVLVALFAFIVLRALRHAMRDEDPFARFAAAGLAILFGTAIGDQHGGEPASHPGQGHDAAVHLLWRLLDDLARLRHGHAAGADARTAARGTAGEPGRPVARRGARPDAQRRRRAARAASRGRRDRRPSVSRRGAGDRARAAAASRSISRPTSAPTRYGGDFPARADPCHPERDVARPRSDLARAHRADARHRRRSQAWRLLRRLQAGGGGRLRRLSDHAAGAGRDAARHPDRDPRAERRDGPRQPAARAARAPRSRPSFPGVLDRDPRARRQGDAHRQSGAARGGRGGGDALSGARRRRAVPPARVRRQPGRARHGRHRAAGDRAARRRRCARGSTIVQQAREEDLARVRDDLCARSASRPRSRRSSPICRRASRRAISWCRAPAPRRSPNSRRSAGPPSWCRCRMRSTRTSAPMPACWSRPAARSVLTQDDFTPERLAAEIAALAADAAASSPRWPRPPSRPGVLDAAERLADLVVQGRGCTRRRNSAFEGVPQ